MSASDWVTPAELRAAKVWNADIARDFARRTEHLPRTGPAEAASKLQAIYAQLPRLDCKRLCRESCGPIPVVGAEALRVRRAHGRRLEILDDTLLCSALSGNDCTIHEVRPLICRLFGLSEGMECPWGCVPERLLSRAEAHALLRDAELP